MQLRHGNIDSTGVITCIAGGDYYSLCDERTDAYRTVITARSDRVFIERRNILDNRITTTSSPPPYRASHLALPRCQSPFQLSARRSALLLRLTVRIDTCSHFPFQIHEPHAPIFPIDPHAGASRRPCMPRRGVRRARCASPQCRCAFVRE